jgi:hypothetical protein
MILRCSSTRAQGARPAYPCLPTATISRRSEGVRDAITIQKSVWPFDDRCLIKPDFGHDDEHRPTCARRCIEKILTVDVAVIALATKRLTVRLTSKHLCQLPTSGSAITCLLPADTCACTK